MARWIGVAGLVVMALAMTGCGASVKEVPAVKSDTKADFDPKAKAMQGMPEDMRKKMEAQKKK